MERHITGGSLGLAVIRDGNGTRSFETLLRYRGAAMAEFWRALRAFKALQAEQAVQQPAEAAIAMAAPASRPGAQVSDRPGPNEPERRAALRLDYAMPAPPLPGRTLHEPAALWLPNEPDSDRQPAPAPTPPGPVPTHPEPRRGRSAVPADTIAAPRRSG